MWLEHGEFSQEWEAGVAAQALACHPIEMHRPPVTVVSQHSAFRDLLPFYSVDMALFAVAIIVGTYALMVWLDSPAATFVTLGGFIGMSVVNWTVKPSYMLIQKGQKPNLVSALESIHYRYVPERDHWVPPLPQWLRWKFNFVKFCPDGGGVRVVGPANILQHLATQLS